MSRPKGSKNKKVTKYDPQKHDIETVLQNHMGKLPKHESKYNAIHDKYSPEPKELGDIVEEVFKYTGIKALVKYVAGEDCGCDQRKENLNEFSKKIKDKLRNAFTTQPLPLTLEEYEYIKQVTDKNPRVLQKDEVIEFYKIHNRVFRTNWEVTGCQDCIKTIYGKLRQLVKIYEA